MPQKKFVTKTDPRTGQETRVEQNVLRTWQDAGGGQVSLFTNGVYGHSDGSPVRRPDEFGLISNKHQRQAAEQWWLRAGKELSKSYYEAIDREERRLSGDYNPAHGADTEKDSTLYYRQDVTSGEIQGPFSWMDLFPKRPDWWGQGRGVAFDDYEYVRADHYEMMGAPRPEPTAGQPGSIPSSSSEPAKTAEDPAWDYFVFKDPDTTYPSKVFKAADHGDGAQMTAAMWAAEKGYQRIEPRPANDAAQAVLDGEAAAARSGHGTEPAPADGDKAPDPDKDLEL